ncbi:BON domain-containing protein [Aeoliella sp. SH292]|uniref:BON domain-containing protein n=1 Tax=Aeoliella sp. SH292 TaxID=3454464 RepID=UPI003F9B0812
MSRQTMIESLVRSAYRRYGYTQLDKVDCHVDRSTLVLTGELPTYHLKQVAQTIAMSLPQVAYVDNRITVPAPMSNSAVQALPQGG